MIQNGGTGYTSAPTFTVSGGTGGTFTATVGGGSVTLGTGGVLTLAGTNASPASFNGTISGAGSLTKNGAGTQIFTGANTYSGTTRVNGGTLSVTGSGTLGSGAALTLGGGTVDLGTTSQTVGAVSITTAASSGNTIQNGSLTGTSYAASNTTGNAIVTASLLANGSAGLTKSGAGTLTLTGANTYSGTTAVNAGTLSVSGSGKLGTGAVLTLGGGNGGPGDDQPDGRRGQHHHGGIEREYHPEWQPDRHLYAASNTTGNAVVTANLLVSGGAGLSKSGAGTVTLTGTNTYSGATTVSGGKLYVNNTSGSGTGTGSVTAQSGGTVAGSGAISGAVTVQSGGTLISGAAQSNAQTTLGGPGVDTITGTGLTLTSNLGVNAGSTLSFNLGAGASTGALNFASPNLNATYLTANGGVTFGTSSKININLVDLTAFSTTGDTLHLHLEQNPYLLIDGTANSDFNLYTTGGYQQNGYVTGVGASNLGGFTIAMFNINGTDITTSSNVTGLQLYLYNGNLEVVPEPGTWAMMLGGLALLVVIQRRRNKLG